MNNQNNSENKNEAPILFEKMMSAIEKRKRQLAHFLGKHSERLSTKNKKIGLLLFGILMGSLSVMLLIEPFYHSNPSTSVLSNKNLSPIVTTPPLNNQPFISPENYDMLINFRKTIDSLKKHDPSTYDEILKDRKGLLDTIDFLLKLY